MVKCKRLRREEHENRGRRTSEEKSNIRIEGGKGERESEKKENGEGEDERENERERCYSPQLLADCKRTRLTGISALCSIKHAKQKAIVKHRFKLSCESAQMLPSLFPFSDPRTTLSTTPTPLTLLILCRLCHENFSWKKIAGPNTDVLRSLHFVPYNIVQAIRSRTYEPIEGYISHLHSLQKVICLKVVK